MASLAQVAAASAVLLILRCMMHSPPVARWMRGVAQRVRSTITTRRRSPSADAHDEAASLGAPTLYINALVLDASSAVADSVKEKLGVRYLPPRSVLRKRLLDGVANGVARNVAHRPEVRRVISRGDGAAGPT